TLPRKGIRFVGNVREDVSCSAEVAMTPGATIQPEEGLPRPPHVTNTATMARDAVGAAFDITNRASIAVLPFTNMSSDPEQDYFADGMAEEILTALSRCKWLFVIARNSSFTYKNKLVDVRQVGRELGVRYVLEGSVRRGGSRVRFTGQLIDAASGVHIWADRFDGEMTELFELQDRITEGVVATIEPKIELAEIERLKHREPASLGAYDLLLRAKQLEAEFTEESLAAAFRCIEEALSID